MNLLQDVIVPQLARPSGPLGSLVASLLDRGNRTINLHVVGALDLTGGQRVLDVGFGGGIGLSLALAHEPSLRLSGVDPSGAMVRRCQRRFGDKVELREGGVEALPWADASFDRVFGANVSYFWRDLPLALAQLRRVLATDGRLVFGIRPPEILQRLGFNEAGHRVWSAAQYVEALRAAGFRDAHARRMPDDGPGTFLLSARRG